MIRRIYNKTFRRFLPRKIGLYNSVAVRYPKLFDITDVFPEWKEGTVGAVREYTSSGDIVVEIGTGFGVCTVSCLRNGCTVHSYEASKNRYEISKETFHINGVTDKVFPNHAIVGVEGEVFGNVGGAKIVDPSSLPSCDVLLTDCEGAEKEILSEMDNIPEMCIIETHGFVGSPTEDIVKILEQRGHTLVDVVSPASTNADPEEDNKVVITRDSDST